MFVRTGIGDLFRVTGVQHNVGRNKAATLPGCGKSHISYSMTDPSHPYRRGCLVSTSLSKSPSCYLETSRGNRAEKLHSYFKGKALSLESHINWLSDHLGNPAPVSSLILKTAQASCRVMSA